MPNRLIHSASLYLRKHAHNPIDWWEWCPEALQTAKAEDKPIFLSIGYSSCHWCTVMEGEAFSDPDIAAYMNAHFLPIKVDREERPDIDSIYMQSLQMMTGSGGWPLN
ncbi:MAG: thioredoxin domain-containing protein, partial [Thermostichales cyanobacterium SZTDM-1c_bins_54]